MVQGELVDGDSIAKSHFPLPTSPPIHPSLLLAVTAMLSLPDEILLDIVEKHVSFFDQTTALCNLSLICKRLRGLSLRYLYRRVTLHDNASIYLFLRSIIHNPELPILVQTLSLRWNYLAGGWQSYALAVDTSTRGVYGKHQRHTMRFSPKHEIKCMYEHAVRNGLAGKENVAREIGTNSETGPQVRAIVLLLSLPNLRSLYLIQEYQLTRFDELFLDLVQRQQQNFLPNLVNLEREYTSKNTEYFSEYSPITISHLGPAMLTPSIQSVTVTCAHMKYVATRALNLRELLVDGAFRHTSPIRTLTIRDSRVEAAALELLLEFPRELRSLSISPWSHDHSHHRRERPHLNTILQIIKTYVASSLQTLNLSSGMNWTIDYFTPNTNFCDFIHLVRLSVPIELLLETNSENLADIPSLLPPTLTKLTAFLGWSPSLEKAESLARLTVSIIKTNQRGEGNIVQIGSELTSWMKLDRSKLIKLHGRATDAGIVILCVEEYGRSLDYYALELDALDM